jgi:hypothetical protein
VIVLAALAPPQGPIEPISLSALLGGGGLGDKALPATFLFPNAAVGDVTLITRIQFGGTQRVMRVGVVIVMVMGHSLEY